MPLTATRLSVTSALIEVRDGVADVALSESKSVTPTLDAIPLSVDVPVRSSTGLFQVTVKFLAAGSSLFEGSASISLPAAGGAAPLGVTLAYTGAGSDATSLTVDPATLTAANGATVSFQATTRNAEDEVVSTPVHWSVSDPLLGTITQTGEFTGAGVTGPVTVTALAATGQVAQSELTLRPTADGIVAQDGSAQSTLPTEAFGTPLSVLVTLGANPLPDVEVAWNVIGGSATLSSPASITDADGMASVSVVASDEAGDVQITATADGNVAPFILTIEPGAPASISAVPPIGGIAQEFVTGPVREPATVVVEDAFGNPVPDVPVTFLVVSGGGSLATADPVLTSAQGLATPEWTLGPQFGEQTASASIPCLPGDVCPTVTLSRFADLRTTASITFLSGPGESVPVGTPVEVRVLVTTQAGVRISNAPFSFRTASGSAELSAASGTTDATGEVAFSVTPQFPGALQVDARVISESIALTINAFIDAVPVGFTHSWIGTSPDWNDAANWSAGTVPTAQDSVVVPPGTPFSPVLTADAAIGSLLHSDSIMLGLGGHALAVHGSVTSSSKIGGAGRVDLLGSEVVVSGTFDSLRVLGTGRLVNALLTHRLEMEAGAELDLDGRTLSVLDSALFRGGFPRMNAPSFLNVHHARFAAGTMPDDLLTSGQMFVTGDLVAAPGEFRASGDHEVHFWNGNVDRVMEHHLDLGGNGESGSRINALTLFTGSLHPVTIDSDLLVTDGMTIIGVVTVPAGVTLTIGGELHIVYGSTVNVAGTISFASCRDDGGVALTGFTCQ